MICVGFVCMCLSVVISFFLLYFPCTLGMFVLVSTPEASTMRQRFSPSTFPISVSLPKIPTYSQVGQKISFLNLASRQAEASLLIRTHGSRNPLPPPHLHLQAHKFPFQRSPSHPFPPFSIQIGDHTPFSNHGSKPLYFSDHVSNPMENITASSLCSYQRRPPHRSRQRSLHQAALFSPPHKVPAHNDNGGYHEFRHEFRSAVSTDHIYVNNSNREYHTASSPLTHRNLTLYLPLHTNFSIQPNRTYT